ncbi:MAG: penicillin-binding protein [Bacteroidales bacterium]
MKNENSDILKRAYVVYFFTVLFALLILGKVLVIQVFQGEKWREMAQNTTMRYLDIEAIRGDICADDGSLLATSVPRYEIRMDLSAQVIKDDLFYSSIDSLSILLSNLFRDRSTSQYRSALSHARRNQERYFLVKRNVSYSQLQEAKKFPLFRLGRFKGGFVLVESTRREMPYKTLAARTIGYERGGIFVGLEGAYRESLEGIHGKRLMQRISGGNWMPINDENEIQPQHGRDLITTINVQMQDVVESALRRKLRESGADYGTAILMEVKTGKIKAISNLTRNATGNFEESFNFAVGESVEPGSTFKLASMIAALEDKVVNPEDLINTEEGQITYFNRTMRDVKKGGHGVITVKHAFEVSSNVGLSKIIYEAYKDNPQRFVDRLKAMGLHEPLGLEIYGEGQPLIREVDSKGWSGVSLPWMAIGYEVSMTPLQILSLYNAVANDGRMMRPMFVEEIRQTGKTYKHFEPQVINRSIASTSTLKMVQEMLVGVVQNGTAQNIHTETYQIAGKTGTAQVANTRHGYRNASGVSYRSSFAGYFPADDPQYSCIVMVHNPKGWIYTGSQISAPVFREISDKIFATQMNINQRWEEQPLLTHLPSFRNAYKEDIKTIYSEFDCRLEDESQSIWVTASVKSDTVSLSSKEFIENLVPDVVGMSLKDAYFVLENAGLRVRFTGRGIVRKQSLRAGTRISPASTIYLEMN